MAAFLSLFLLFCCLSCRSLSLTQDGLHLLQAKSSLDDPDSSLSDWSPSDAHPCNWTGVICAPPPLFPAVTALDLSDLGLIGPFPSPLCLLLDLSSLSLSLNSLNSSLSSSSSSFLGCSSLTRLDLSQNSFTGPLPTFLPSLLPRLSYLDLSVNNFSGPIPFSFGQFASLRSLSLVGNLLSGPVPAFLSNLSSLHELNLSYNPFTPTPLPPSLANLTSLRVLWLTSCNLIGSIPPSLGRLSNLTDLDLSYNSISGDIPDSLAGLSSVVQIELCSNYLTGPLPSGLSNLTQLRLFDASMNQLSGQIPEDVFLAPSVESFRLYENNLTGAIPSTITRCDNLAELRLFSNQLDGPLPADFGKNSPLSLVDLSDNLLSGEIPTGICGGGMLDQLLLLDNMFSGSLPESLGQCSTLTRVRLLNNRLSGEVPPAFWGLPHVWLLELAGNSFTGGISPAISGATNLSKLVISDNQFEGRIPEEMGALTNLHEFSAANNRLTGPLPEGLYHSSKEVNRATEKPNWMLTSFHKLGFNDNEISGCLDEDNVIGSGASGKVYKAVLSNGEAVAVKKLCETPGKTDVFQSVDDGFEAEVAKLGTIMHKNIVKLWCCCTRNDCKLLVYEYMPHGSLGDQLHGSKGGLLDWPTRYKIAVDAAQGLSYLHHDCVPPIVHRGIKSNNILLDEEFGAKVADFGVAKAIVGKDPKSMSIVAGSYGVVILELVTGRRPADTELGEKDLARWVRSSVEHKGVDRVLDPKLDVCYKAEMCKVLDIGLLCASILPISRPSMRVVIKMLLEVGSENKQLEPAKDRSQVSLLP
ncbi:hypothetical protein BHM03_00051277 [Ensete ventricosum]|nr:hypothetical protein BHM03_00051277 [Ensete ventricosum]